MILRKMVMVVLLLLLGSNLTQGMCSTACNICSHTTFVPRTMAQNLVLELALHNYYSYHQRDCGECPPLFSFQVTAPYFFKSTKNKKIAQYFLPKCQECIVVGQNNTSDVSSVWLDVSSLASTPFSSTLCLRPTRTVIGGAVRLFFDFASWLGCDECPAHNWWASIFIPIQQVRHDLNMTETRSLTSGVPLSPPGFASVIAALNNPEWDFGKFSPTKLKHTSVDDVCVKFGFDPIRDCSKHLGFYLLGFVPTGRGTKSEFLFEPLVGSNHGALGFGITFDAEVYSCNSRSIDFMFEGRYAHSFKHNEIRSIDLFNGDWSRYLIVVTPEDTTTPLPGINFFTKEVEVNPRDMYEVWAALNFSCCNLHLEVGYDFWMRSKEKIRLADQDLGVGILDVSGIVNSATSEVCPTTAHCARICQGVPNQPDAPVSDAPAFIPVRNSNSVTQQGTSLDGNTCNGPRCSSESQCSFLNLDSAAHPRALSSTIYAAISWNECVCCRDVMIGVGGQYEFAHRHSALSQYGVWLKTAISF